jgi:propanol-preferring alcohol dehydrogenase
LKAAVVHEYKEPLRVEDVETPEPGAGEIIIKVEACGVCHSDLHLAEGDWKPLLKRVKLPLIPGHEVVGKVVAKGEGVTQLEIGDRVGVAWIHWTCGECDMCREGRENLCSRQVITGATVDGGYAEFIKANASHALKAPEQLSPEEVAPMYCAGLTVYRAIKLAEIEPHQRVAIVGIGGLGHLAVQIAKNYGAEVIAIDVADEKLQLARDLGADITINAKESNAVKEMKKLGGVHKAIVTSAAKAAYDTALFGLRGNGKLMIVGMPADDIPLPAILLREITVMASATGTRNDLRELLELAAGGKVKCRVETRPLQEINEVFDEMKQGKISGRIVLNM